MDNKYTVRSVDGSIDIEASVAAFRVDLEVFLYDRDEKQARIDSAVEAVFVKNNQVRLPKSMLIDGVCAELGVSSESHTSTAKLVEVYLRENASTDGTRRFLSVKGQKGGFEKTQK